jgi:CheY-like chemotaxis protein
MATDSRSPARRSILLVEDHADTRLMYVEFLGPHYDMQGVGDGIAALEAMAARRPDLLITDLALPRMDGFELIARVRGDSRFSDIPIVALSGYTGAETDQRLTQVPPVTVLQKPCLPETLVDVVEKHLRGKTNRER